MESDDPQADVRMRDYDDVLVHLVPIDPKVRASGPHGRRKTPMTAGRGRRWGWIALGVLAVLIAGGLVAFRVAIGVLKGRVVEALGS